MNHSKTSNADLLSTESVTKSRTDLPLFDPVHLAEKTRKAVCRGNMRKYLGFGTTPDYKTGVATGYTVGCNLRCIFCWAHETRDNFEREMDFYSPEEVYGKLMDLIKMNPGMNKARISDGEPTLCKDHILELIELFEKSDAEQFILETNGILMGNDPEFVKELSKFKKLYVRVDLKAGTPEAFSKKTGALPEAFDLPFKAVRSLSELGMCFGVAAMSADPRFMDPLERVSLVLKLGEIAPELVLRLEEEMTILFPTARQRLEARGWDLENKKVPALLRKTLGKYIQVSYEPIRLMKKQKISWRFTLKNIRQLRHGI